VRSPTFINILRTYLLPNPEEKAPERVSNDDDPAQSDCSCTGHRVTYCQLQPPQNMAFNLKWTDANVFWLEVTYTA